MSDYYLNGKGCDESDIRWALYRIIQEELYCTISTYSGNLKIEGCELQHSTLDKYRVAVYDYSIDKIVCDLFFNIKDIGSIYIVDLKANIKINLS
jgi:hypothetical protein